MTDSKETDIRDLFIAISRIETKVDSLGNVREIAIEAQQSTKSAHTRIDSVITDHEKKYDKLEGHVTWLWRLVLGGLMTGLISFLFFLAQKGV